jgi:hypothetical protein
MPGAHAYLTKSDSVFHNARKDHKNGGCKDCPKAKAKENQSGKTLTFGSGYLK